MKRSIFQTIRRGIIRLFRNFIMIPFDRNNKTKWANIQGKFAGQRAFILGNGPSLNHTPLYLLKGEHVMCFNRFGLIGERLNFSPDMYMIVDDIVALDNKEDVKDNIKRSKYVFLPNINFGTGVTNFKRIFGEISNVYWLNVFVKRFSRKRLDKVMGKKEPWVLIGRTVATSGLEILMKLGFSEIYILGVDMNYVIHKDVENLDKDTHIRSKADDDPNHFDPRYFGKGKEYHQPVQETMDIMMGALNDISEFAKDNGYSIYNATVGGMVECFPRVDIYDVLKDKDQDYMFDSLLMYKTGLRLSSIDMNTTITFDNFLGDIDVCVINESEIELFIKKYINNYLPLGPYSGKYLLIKRDHVIK